MRISAFASETATQPSTLDVSWSQLAEALSASRTSGCTSTTCTGKTCPHKLGPAWSPVAYRAGSTRGNRNVETIEALAVDVDHVDDDGLKAVAERLAPYRYIAHSTHNDKPGDRALRVILELSEPVPAADWPRFWPAAMRALGMPGDEATKDAARLFFLPSHPQDRPPLFVTNEGTRVDTAAILAQAPPAAPPQAAEPEAWTGGTPASPAVLQAARERLVRHGPAIVGQGGDKHTYEVGAILFRGFDLTFDEAWPLAVEWNERNPGRKWTLERLADKLRNGAAYAQGPAGAERAVIEGAARLAALVPGLNPWEAALVQARGEVAAALVTSALEKAPEPLFVASSSLHTKLYPPAPWLVEGLITEGAVVVVGGEPKISKTWTWSEIAIAVATGTPAFGEFAVKRRRVAYFYAEDLDRQVRNRQRALIASRGLGVEALDGLFVQPRGKFLDVLNDDDLALVVASVRRLGDVGLLILEPLRDLHSGEEDSSDSMRDVMRRLRLLSELTGCTVGVAHHTAKAGVDTGKRRQGQRLRGSGAIHGSVDCGIYLGGLTGDGRNEFGCEVQSEVKGARSAGYFNLTLNVEDDAGGEAIRASWRYSKTAPESSAGSSRDAEDDAVVLERAQLATLNGRVTSERKLRDMCHPVPDKRARVAISRLLSSGALRHVTGTDEWGRRCEGIAPAPKQEG